MKKVMIWFFTLSFIGLGLQTDLADVKKAGLEGMMVGYAAGSIKLILALVAIESIGLTRDVRVKGPSRDGDDKMCTISSCSGARRKQMY